MRPQPVGLPAAENLFRLAANQEALARLDVAGSMEPATQFLRARILLRLDRPAEAASLLRQLDLAKDSIEAAERGVLLGSALGLLRDFDAGLAELRKARATALPPALDAEATYATALNHWLRHDNSSAESELRPLLVCADPNERARARVLLAWIAIRRQEVRKHIEFLVGALDDLEKAGDDVNVYYLARTLNTLATLCKEMPLREETARVRRLAATLPPTSGIQAERFHILRALGWIDALNGDNMAAFRQLKQAAAIAPNDPLALLSLLDRAYLARNSGESGYATDLLDDAQQLAKQVVWTETRGEERAALLLLAELLAPVEPREAVACLDRFRSLQSADTLPDRVSTDARVAAFMLFSTGVAYKTLGEMDKADGPLRDAWSTFEAFSYVWRSALAAQHLAEVTKDDNWHTIAANRIKPYPNSWIDRWINRSDEAGEELPYLTPAQRQVFDALCDGATTNDIAARLSRSPNTVRNHISEIFNVFSVRSRAELLAKLRRA